MVSVAINAKKTISIHCEISLLRPIAVWAYLLPPFIRQKQRYVKWQAKLRRNCSSRL